MSLTPYLRSWRTTPLHDREVIDALVDRAHEAPSRELTATVDVGLTTTADASKMKHAAGNLFYYDVFIDVPPLARAR